MHNNHHNIDQRVIDLHIAIPKAPKPVASYVGCVQVNDLLFISGQLPMENGEIIYHGVVEKDITLNDAKKAARLCAINILAQIKDVIGSLNKVEKIVRINGFVCCQDNFHDHPTVINGASDLLQEVFGEKGKHSRIALGAISLPKGASVEIDAIIKICA